MYHAAGGGISGPPGIATSDCSTSHAERAIKMRAAANWPLVDSREGMAMLMDWARAGGFVLNGAHKKMAIKWGVDTSGVMFNDPIPTVRLPSQKRP